MIPSELIRKLQALIKEHSDVEDICFDSSSGPTSITKIEVDTDEHGKFILLKA